MWNFGFRWLLYNYFVNGYSQEWIQKVFDSLHHYCLLRQTRIRKFDFYLWSLLLDAISQKSISGLTVSFHEWLVWPISDMTVSLIDYNKNRFRSEQKFEIQKRFSCSRWHLCPPRQRRFPRCLRGPGSTSGRNLEDFVLRRERMCTLRIHPEKRHPGYFYPAVNQLASPKTDSRREPQTGWILLQTGTREYSGHCFQSQQ